MKTVTLLRHAKSDWSDAVTRDFDRPLNAKGQRAARTMGEWARRDEARFDIILASPAIRVVETIDGFLDGYTATVDIRWDRRIYLASSVTLLDVLREMPDSASHILMVGHNPGLEDLVLDLVPDTSEDLLRQNVEVKFPTASMATLRFAADRWSEIGKPARISAFTRPRDVDPSLGPEAREQARHG